MKKGPTYQIGGTWDTVSTRCLYNEHILEPLIVPWFFIGAGCFTDDNCSCSRNPAQAHLNSMQERSWAQNTWQWCVANTLRLWGCSRSNWLIWTPPCQSLVSCVVQQCHRAAWATEVSGQSKQICGPDQDLQVQQKVILLTMLGNPSFKFAMDAESHWKKWLMTDVGMTNWIWWNQAFIEVCKALIRASLKLDLSSCNRSQVFDSSKAVAERPLPLPFLLILLDLP